LNCQFLLEKQASAIQMLRNLSLFRPFHLF